MLFRKKLPKSCSYCMHGTQVSGDQILCVKNGVVSAYYKCRKFSYDPCKRIPRKTKALNFTQYNEKDFTL